MQGEVTKAGLMRTVVIHEIYEMSRDESNGNCPKSGEARGQGIDSQTGLHLENDVAVVALMRTSTMPAMPIGDQTHDLLESSNQRVVSAKSCAPDVLVRNSGRLAKDAQNVLFVVR